MPLFLDEADAHLEVRVKGIGGGVSAPVNLDIYRAVNVHWALSEEHTDPVALIGAWKEWLAAQGVPPLSDTNANRLIAEAQKAVAAFKKKHELESPPPGSAGSSGSTAPDSPPQD